MTPDDVRRGPSWNLDIATTLLGSPGTDVGHDCRWEGLGGFSVDRRDGSWYCFGTGDGGRSPVKLVRFLKPEFSKSEARAFIEAFLAAHPGVGSCKEVVPDDDVSETRSRAIAAYAREIVAERIDIAGTDGERYLESRGLGPAPYSLPLWWYPDIRAGEGAIVADLVADNRTVAILCTYVDAHGRKSVVEPARQRFNLEPHQPGAVIPIAAAEPGVVDITCDTVLTEGIENGASLVGVKHPAWRIVALPGIGALKSMPVRKGERIIVFQDSDPPDSPASKGLEAGVDALLLQEAVVRVTDRAEGDANAILNTEGKGAAELKRLLARPAGAALSFGGEADRLAKLPPTEYEKARKAAARAHGVRVGHLDREVAGRRPKDPEVEDGSTTRALDMPEDPSWIGPVPPLVPALDAAVAEMPRYLVAPAHYYDIIAVWSAATHLAQREDLALPVMPQISPQAVAEDSGKTVALEIVVALCRRGSLRSSYSAATLFRRINAEGITPVLDEVHHRLPHDPDLQQIFNACHRRAASFVDRTETMPDGKRVVVSYRCWAPLAWASIGAMPAETQSRAIVLPMVSALPDESAKLEHSSPTTSGVLIDVRRQLAAWAGSVTALPHVETPGLFNRGSDLWRILLQVAALAGGEWPARLTTAIEELRKVESRPSLTVRLLTSILDAFGEDAKPNTFLATEDELLPKLWHDTEAGWNEANHGRPITAYWLREHLRGLLDPPGSQQENYTDEAGTRRNRRGYYRHQFDKASRYLPPQRSASSASSAAAGPDAADTASVLEADRRAASASSSASKNPRQTAPPEAGEGVEADEADEADAQASIDAHEYTPEAASSRPVEIGDFVQWTSSGVDQFKEPRRVVGVFEDGAWAQVEGSTTGVPTAELTVVRPAPATDKHSTSNGPEPAGVDPETSALIRDFVAEHPTVSVDTISRRLHIKKSTIGRVLQWLRR